MIKCWKDRRHKSNVFVHLRGNPQKRGETDPDWISAQLHNFITHEMVCNATVAQDKTNKIMIKAGKDVADHMANTRLSPQQSRSRRVTIAYLEQFLLPRLVNTAPKPAGP